MVLLFAEEQLDILRRLFVYFTTCITAIGHLTNSSKSHSKSDSKNFIVRQNSIKDRSQDKIPEKTGYERDNLRHRYIRVMVLRNKDKLLKCSGKQRCVNRKTKNHSNRVSQEHFMSTQYPNNRITQKRMPHMTAKDTYLSYRRTRYMRDEFVFSMISGNRTVLILCVKFLTIVTSLFPKSKIETSVIPMKTPTSTLRVLVLS